MSDASTVKGYAPLEWRGVDEQRKHLLDRIIIERGREAVTVTDGPTGKHLFTLVPEDLAQRSVVSTLVARVAEFYCGSCGELLGTAGCTMCDVDRRKRLRATIALLEEPDV
jgi:hypothetical protein